MDRDLMPGLDGGVFGWYTVGAVSLLGVLLVVLLSIPGKGDRS